MSSTRSTTAKVRRSSAALLLAGALGFAALASAAADDRTAAAVAVLRGTTDDVVGILNDKALAKDARLRKLEDIALDRFDFPRMTQLVLGKNRSALNPEQQAQFEKEFRQHLSLTYGRQLDKYTSNEKIEIGEARLEANGDVTVKTRVVGGAAGQGVQIDYRLRANQGRWLVIDVIPEGVSLIQNFRSQVQEIVTQKGVAHLIETLHQKNLEREQARTAS